MYPANRLNYDSYPFFNPSPAAPARPVRHGPLAARLQRAATFYFTWILLASVLTTSLMPVMSQRPSITPAKAADSPPPQAQPIAVAHPITSNAPAISAGQPEIEPVKADSPLKTSRDQGLTSAFVSDHALADGSRQALVSTTPLNYQDADGNWQPIDPRFKRAVGGFTNFTNLLQISAAARQAVLHLKYQDNMIGWEPASLTLDDPDGVTTPIAQPLQAQSSPTGTLSASSTDILYQGGWSLSDIQEQVSSGAGQAEQQLIFQKAPGNPQNEPSRASLALNATLHLLRGYSLYAGGKVRDKAFSASGPIEIRDAAGKSTITLALPYAFEKDHPEQSVMGSYRFTPKGDGQWRVAVTTPWSWWRAPARKYPVVLDPIMEVLRTVREKTIVENQPCSNAGSVSSLVIGKDPACGQRRGLLAFDNLPILPQGFTLREADLILTTGGIDNGRSSLRKGPYDVQVYGVSSNWDASINWGSQPGVGSMLDQEPMYSVFTRENNGFVEPTYFYATKFVLQTGSSGVVSDWLSDKSHNYGVEIRDAGENKDNCYNNNHKRNLSGCLAIYIVTGTNYSLWSAQDKAKFQNPQTPASQPWFVTQKAGVALLLQYNPPTLPEGQPYPLTSFSPLPSNSDVFAYTDHQYNLPASSSTWTAVSVKGLHKFTISGVAQLQAAGNMSLNKVCADGTPNCKTIPSQGNFPSQPNYFLVHGNPANYHIQAQIPLPNSKDPANANLDGYIVEADSSQPLGAGNPQLSANTTITYTYPFTTGHILKVFNMNLVDNTRVAVKVNYTALHPITHRIVPFPVEAYAFKPVSDGAVSGRDSGVVLVGFNNASTGSKLRIDSGQGGAWALVVDYPGDLDPTFTEPALNFPYQIRGTAQVIIHACSINAIPTDSGCQIVQKPDAATPFVDVGPYRVYSQAGFSPANCSGSTSCQTLIQKGNQRFTPFITWRGNPLDRVVAVAEDTVDINLATNNLSTLNGELWLTHFNGTPKNDMLQVARGYYQNDPNTNLLVPSGASYPGLPLEASDATQARMDIDVQNEAAHGSADITRQVESSPGTLAPLTFNLAWTVYAEGYKNVSPTVTQTGGPSQLNVSSLNLRFGPSWGVDLDPSFAPNGRFTNLRNYGKIVQPDSMGGAWQNIQAVILPNGINLPGPDANGSPCNGNCLDLRAMDDSFSHLDRHWKLPDVLVTGSAHTVMFSKPGDLTIFSSDQPHALNATTVPFRFSTFQGDVTVTEAVCPGGSNTQEVTVITGTTHISLPGLGDSSNDQPISATFTLCETALRQVSLTFSGPPDIPVGATGLLVDKLSGSVTIGPSNTRVSFSVNYKDASNIVTGNATVTLDTAGLFDIQATGKVIAQVDYSGHAWVAWNPLDVGVDVSASFHHWLTGEVHAHLWKGQGWQHRYNWLPDNGETHFAGSIAAQVRISEGQAFDWWFIEIPPFDITFGIEVAFGQFCANSSCTSYEWGVKGKFTVAGFDVGIYYGFSSGFDFILGSDGHVLIDQHRSSSPADESLAAAKGLSPEPMSNGKPLAVQRSYVSDPNAPQVSEPLTVTANTGSFLAGLSWARGAPQLTLVRPDAVEINPSNAASYGVVVSDKLQYRLYGVKNPMPGTWQAKISRATSKDDYHVVFLANKKPPAIQFQAPATNETLSSNETSYTIRWTPPANPPNGVDLRVSLYYTVTASTAVTNTQQYGGVIRENIPISQGQYDWDLSYLAKGTYHVYARVFNGMKGNSGIQPHPSQFGTDQVPGYQKVVAPGTIVLQDTIAPSIPSPWNVTLKQRNDAFLACWPALAAHDLSGYTILYTRADVDGVVRLFGYSIPATVQYSNAPNAPQQCTRIGGLNDYNDLTVAVAGYDSSGNYSKFTSPAIGTPTSTQPDEAPSPGALSGSVGANYTVNLQWTGAGSLPAGAGYRVYYAQEASAGPGQFGTGATAGDSPIDVGNTTSTALQGLAPGYFYHFIVQTYDAEGRVSPFSNEVVLLLTNGADNNHDGLPDDWEKAHNILNPNADPDGDGLTNLQEFQRRTNPNLWDTDGDGFSDGDEVNAGSNPLDPNSTPVDPTITPNYTSPPDLSLDKDHLIFYAYSSSVPPLAQTVQIANLGQGNLVPSAASGAGWMQLQLLNGDLHVAVNPRGLSPGHYHGKITVSGAPGSMTQDSPQTVNVDLWLMAGSNPHQKMYLPVLADQH